MRTLLALFLLSCSAYAQEAVVVHINAEFNKSNDWYALDQLEDARVFNGYIERAPTIKKEYNVTKVPTLILLYDRKEVMRWEGQLDMKLHITAKEVQKEIDKL